MATKKKSRKPAKPKTSVSIKKKRAAKKTSAAKKKMAAKKRAPGKAPVTKRKAAAKQRGTTMRGTKQRAKKKTAIKAKPVARKAAPKKVVATKATSKKPTKKPRGKRAITFALEAPESRSGRQSGDLQGLSTIAGADSESVTELAEEGNAFEAAALAGVEEAGAGRSVRTHQVLEDDVPEEYLEKD